MGKKKSYPPFKEFHLGLNNKTEANLIDDRELAEAVNVVIGRGFLSKRHGYIAYATLSNPITKLYDFYRNNGTKEFLAVSGTNLYKDSSGTFNSVTMTNALTSSTTKLVTYKDRNMNDVVLIADGGKLKTYNGTEVKEVVPYGPLTTPEQTDPGLNDLTNLSKFRCLAIKKDRVFGVGHPTIKNRLSFCHIDPTRGYGVYDYWPAPFFIDIAVEDNDEIVEIKVFRDALIIFCKRSIWALYGSGRTMSDYELIKINVPTGCIAKESIVEVGNNIFYLSETHVYALTSTDMNYVSAEIVSTRIEKSLDGISLTDKEKAVGTYFKDKFYLSFPNGLTIVYDTLLDAWTTYTNVQSNSFINHNNELYFGSNTNKVYKFDENTWSDDGQAIVFHAKFKNMDFGLPVNDKTFRRLWTVSKQYEALSSDYNVKAVIDYVVVDLDDLKTDQSLVWDEGFWGKAFWGFKDVVQEELKIKKEGKNFQLLITNDSLDQPFTFYAMTFEIKVKKA